MLDPVHPAAEAGASPRAAGLRASLINLLVVAFYYRRIVLLAFAVPVAIGLYAAIVGKPVFVADERLLVLLGSEYVYQPQVGQAGSGATLDRNQIMQSELEILQSDFLRVAVVRKIGIGRLYPDLDPATRIPSVLRMIAGTLHLGGGTQPAAQAVASAEAAAAERVRRNLTVTAVAQTNVIQLSFRSTDRAMSAEVLNTLVQLYFDRRAEVFRPTDGGANGPEDQAAGQRLQAAEAALARFSDAHQIASFDEQMTRLIDQQAATSTDQLKIEQQINALKAQITTLRGQVARLPRSVQLYAEAERAATSLGSADDLVRLESTYRSLASHYQPGSPQLAVIEEQLARARAEAGRSQALSAKDDRRGQNPEWLTASTHLEEAEVELQGALGREAQLLNSMKAINARIDELTEAGAHYRDLKRARDVLAETLQVYTHNREEARLAGALDRGRLNNIRIVQPAMPPATGSGQGLILLGGGIAAGVLLALAALALLNALRETMLSATDMERELQLPVLVAIPRLPSRHTRATATGLPA
jgi:uncharacterized protein involved in exopolysaccharide biosynthesis